MSLTRFVRTPEQIEEFQLAYRNPVFRSREGVVAGTEGVDFSMPEIGALTLRLVDAETRESIPIGFEECKR